MKIKCTAMLEDFFIKSNEKSLEMVRTNGQRVRGVISRRDDNQSVDDMITEGEGEGVKKLFSEGDTRIFENVPFISSCSRICVNLFVLSALIIVYQQILIFS